MRKIRLLIDQLLLLTLCSSPALWKLVDLSAGAKIAAIILLSLFYIVYLISAGGRQDKNSKLNRIAKGTFLIDGSVLSLFLHTVIVILLIILSGLNGWRQVANAGQAVEVHRASVYVVYTDSQYDSPAVDLTLCKKRVLF